MATTRREARAFRKQRVRRKISGTSLRPRLAVYRSLKHIYAQLIDDTSGVTLASASTTEKTMRTDKSSANKVCAKSVGELIAERAKQKGIETVVFDRGSFLYHGRVKAVAEAAREKGLQF